MEKVSGFFDLCVNESAVAGNYEETIKTLFNYGYRTIAINYEMEETEVVTNASNQGKKKRKGLNAAETSQFPQVRPRPPVAGCESMTILLRLTVHLATKDFYARIYKMPEFKQFDIIAILPLNQAIFGVVSTELEADILTMKTHCKSDYRILRKNYNQMLSNGFYFELPYTPAVLNDSGRRIVISNAHNLHVVGKSRNIIISSGITTAAQIRSPYDIINLGLIFGLSQAQSKMAVMQNCRNVYYRAVSRRYGKIAMVGANVPQAQDGSTNMNASVIEIDDDDVDVADVGHQLKKIKA